MRKGTRKVSELGRSQRLRIIRTLKKTQGLSITELSQRLSLSYMGVKQHCGGLEREGLVDTWRRAKGVGRPEMVYRLTEKARTFFPTSMNAATIEILHAAKQLYGPAAPEKLLFAVFVAKAEGYRKVIPPGDLPARAARFAKIRDDEGYLAEFVLEPEPAIVEYHSPILDLLEAFPLVRRLEKEMIEKVLGVAVSREEKTASGLYQCRYVLPEIARLPASAADLPA